MYGEMEIFYEWTGVWVKYTVVKLYCIVVFLRTVRLIVCYLHINFLKKLLEVLANIALIKKSIRERG